MGNYNYFLGHFMSKNKPAMVIWHLQEARICALTAFLTPFVISQGYKSFQRINFVRTISSVQKGMMHFRTKTLRLVD